jgi:hypothetical protein
MPSRSSPRNVDVRTLWVMTPPRSQRNPLKRTVTPTVPPRVDYELVANRMARFEGLGQRAPDT